MRFNESKVSFKFFLCYNGVIYYFTIFISLYTQPEHVRYVVIQNE